MLRLRVKLALQYPNNRNKNPFFSFSCNRYRQSPAYCTTHHIRYDDLYNLVLDGIQDKQNFVKTHKNELALYAQKLADRGADIQLKYMRSTLDKSVKRSKELDVIIQKMLEQTALGVLSQERFATLTAIYEEEQSALKIKIADLEVKVSDRGGDMKNTMRFFDLVRKHEDVTELTQDVLHEFIESVVVHQATGGRKHREQKVIINYRFIKDNWFIF